VTTVEYQIRFAHEHQDIWQLQKEEYLKAVEIERQQKEQ